MSTSNSDDSGNFFENAKITGIPATIGSDSSHHVKRSCGLIHDHASTGAKRTRNQMSRRSTLSVPRVEPRGHELAQQPVVVEPTAAIGDGILAGVAHFLEHGAEHGGATRDVKVARRHMKGRADYPSSAASAHANILSGALGITRPTYARANTSEALVPPK